MKLSTFKAKSLAVEETRPCPGVRGGLWFRRILSEGRALSGVAVAWLASHGPGVVTACWGAVVPARDPVEWGRPRMGPDRRTLTADSLGVGGILVGFSLVRELENSLLRMNSVRKGK